MPVATENRHPPQSRQTPNAPESPGALSGLPDVGPSAEEQQLTERAVRHARGLAEERALA